MRQLETPTLSTLHRRLDLAEYVQLFCRFRDVPIVSISATQNARVPAANWIATVPHGLLADLHAFRPTPDRYLAFLGRIAPEKGTANEHLASYRQGGLHLPRVVG